VIHRQNWLDVRAYLHYIERVRQNDPETVKRARSHLRHLLEWADASPLPRVRTVDPTFPTYLLTARADGKAKTLAPASIVKCLAFTRQFFSHARAEWPLRYKSISESWVELLQPPRAMRADSRLVVHQFYALEDVQHIAAVATETLHEERGKVAVAMLYLSAMRADALASLPISCVDIARRTIRQLPEAGVHTKNSKAAETYLLEIPDLLAVVEAWDHRVRDTLPPSALWYATLSNDGMATTPTTQAFAGRNNTVQRDVRLICERAGVTYLSPHKLRHGHVMWARQYARDMDDFKAISQNIMHSSMVITDSTYGNMLNDSLRTTIARLGTSQTGDEKSIEAKLDELLKLVKIRG
jgi:site-specific recombinase XerD